MIGDSDELRCQDKFNYDLNAAWKIPMDFVIGISLTYKSCKTRFESHLLSNTKILKNIP